jgi:hypothetical protein
MSTKIYIQYKEPQHKKWHFASCIIEEEIKTNEEAEELLDWGSKYNNFIALLVDDSVNGCLSTWEVVTIERTNETPNSSINYGDVSPIILEIEAAEKINEKLRLETIKIKEDTAKMQQEIIKIKAENLAILKNHYELNDSEAEWANANWEFIKESKRYFKLSPEFIRDLYAKATNTKVVPTPEAFEPIKEVEANGEFILVLDTKVPIQLFKDYITHLHTVKSVKSWQMHEYENKRVILHQRIFEALGADRIHRDEGRGREVYFAIEEVISKVHRCLCGGEVDGNSKCVKCYSPVDGQTYYENLKNLSI